MQKTIHSFAIVASCCLGLLALPQVGHSQNFYLDADAGVALADDVKISQFLVPTPGVKFKLDTGARFSVAGGYHFNDYIGAQIETGFIFNEVKGVSGGGNIDAALTHTPLLFDFVVRYDKPNSKFVPYAGVGVGGDISVILVDNVRAPNGAVVDGAGSAAVFAWQAFAGARYKLNEKMSIGGGYKFFSANGARWDVEDSSGEIKSGAATVHSVVVDFTMKF